LGLCNQQSEETLENVQVINIWGGIKKYFKYINNKKNQ